MYIYVFDSCLVGVSYNPIPAMYVHAYTKIVIDWLTSNLLHFAKTVIWTSMETVKLALTAPTTQLDQLPR